MSGVRYGLTEPTMEGGVWTLSKFMWMCRRRISRIDMDDLRFSLPVEADQFLIECRGDLDEWMRGMPRVHRWDKRPRVTRETDFLNDVSVLTFMASGVFALGDEPQMEKLLGLVNVESLSSVPDVVYHEGLPVERMATPEYVERMVNTRVQSDDAVEQRVEAVLRESHRRIEAVMRDPGITPEQRPSYIRAENARRQEELRRARFTPASPHPVGVVRHETDENGEMRVVMQGPRIDWMAPNNGGLIDWDAAYRRTTPTSRAQSEAERIFHGPPLGRLEPSGDAAVSMDSGDTGEGVSMDRDTEQ